jgi:hypothetical protein
MPDPGTAVGLLCVVAQFFPGRGMETGGRVDTGKAAQLEPALADIMARHFS